MNGRLEKGGSVGTGTAVTIPLRGVPLRNEASVQKVEISVCEV